MFEAEGKRMASAEPQLLSQIQPGPVRPDIAMVLPFPCWGGVETVFLNLVRYFAGEGVSVDMVFSRARGPLLGDFQEYARIIDMENPLMMLHQRERYAFLDLPKVKRYIGFSRPRSILAARSLNYCVARAKRDLGFAGRAVISHHIDVQAGRQAMGSVQRAVGAWFESYYRHADAVVGVAKAVTDGLHKMGLPKEKLHTIYNPVVTDEMFRLAEEQPAHKWLDPKRHRVILGAGRFTPQKDFENLIRAFALARVSSPDSRLIIIGDGPDRGKLERLVRDLELNGCVDMPGSERNPYPFMKSADLYVLSSRYEGLGLTLVESLALGTPVVSTDCPSGPAEVLDRGRYGALVPIEDPKALARAMVEALANPCSTEEQVRWATETFSVRTAGKKYLALLGVGSECSDA